MSNPYPTTCTHTFTNTDGRPGQRHTANNQTPMVPPLSMRLDQSVANTQQPSFSKENRLILSLPKIQAQTSMAEAGIVLTFRNPASIFILTDSQAAYHNFSKGQIGPIAHRVLTQLLSQRSEEEWKQLIWIPKHCGARSARELLLRTSDPGVSRPLTYAYGPASDIP
ncbi:hypothetical protein HPB50_029023 [Hyalomma asiaticum]|nr:hypothetical protein HPB50_029023 [Hyalomma asiaticum]